LAPRKSRSQPAGAGAQRRVATGSLPPPQFDDSERGRKLTAAFREIEGLFTGWVERQHMPGAVLGIIVDGELACLKAAGVRELKGRAAVTPDTVFRIASMTKSFTALSILKLRAEDHCGLFVGNLQSGRSYRRGRQPHEHGETYL
jgi:CubicO group peptidase (beta-lactamase class C family)